MSRPLARLFGYWRTGRSGPAIVRQAGTAVNYFGAGLILPFEIIYLHEVRGFTTAMRPRSRQPWRRSPAVRMTATISSTVGGSAG